MSPIDDELRAALHRRARVLDPSPDPLAGIERRARRMRRNRIGAAVAGSALAVTAVAGVVPLLQGTSPVPDRPPVATAAPTLEPTPGADPGAGRRLVRPGPATPWAPRGERSTRAPA
jgi:hypothetical protein